MKKFLFLFCVVVLSVVAKAQDVIITKNSERIEARIVEISDEEVRFKRIDNLDGPVFVLTGASVASVVFENGEVFVFKTSNENNQGQSQNYETAPIERMGEYQKTMNMTLGSVVGGGGGNIVEVPDEQIKYDPQLYMSYKRMSYYYGGLKISDKTCERLLRDNCKKAYKMYKQSNVSLICFSVFLGASLGSIIPAACVSVIYGDDVSKYFFYVSAGLAGASLISLSFEIPQRRKSVKIFNKECTNNANNTSFSVSSSNNSMGLTFSLKF